MVVGIGIVASAIAIAIVAMVVRFENSNPAVAFCCWIVDSWDRSRHFVVVVVVAVVVVFDVIATVVFETCLTHLQHHGFLLLCIPLQNCPNR